MLRPTYVPNVTERSTSGSAADPGSLSEETQKVGLAGKVVIVHWNPAGKPVAAELSVVKNLLAKGNH